MTVLIKKLTLALVACSFAFSAWAISLDQAKNQGLVGEMPNGYLGVIKANAEVSQLVNEVNSKRKSLYLKLAKKNKITLAQVAALAGEKAIAKTRSGHFIKSPSGSWQKK